MKKISLMILAFVLVGCASKPVVNYVDPGAQGKIAGTGIESQDINAAAQKAAQEIVNISEISNAKQPPTIIITPVINKSASPIDTSIYTTKLRGILMQNTKGKVKFLARDASWNTNVEEENLRKSGAVSSHSKGDKHVGATYDYLLTAELQGISATSSQGHSDYFLIAFKLVDYKDILIWESQYEVKKEGKESAVYR